MTPARRPLVPSAGADPRTEPALHAETTGHGPRLVLAHGFTQTGRLWGPFGQALATRHELVRVDLPGHAGATGVRADLTEGGNLLVAAGANTPDVPAGTSEAPGGPGGTAGVGLGPHAAEEPGVGAPGGPGGTAGAFDLLGYSLGARFALHAALARPDLVRRLVLIGATAGIEDPAARARRRRHDEALADDLERSGDLDGFLRRWLAAPMFATLRAPDLGERRRNTPAGLASSLRLAGTGTQRPLWEELGRLPMPVLVLAGADDPRFVVAGTRMARALPAGVLSLVPGAGHAAHLQQPALTARIVEQFLG